MQQQVRFYLFDVSPTAVVLSPTMRKTCLIALILGLVLLRVFRQVTENPKLGAPL